MTTHFVTPPHGGEVEQVRRQRLTVDYQFPHLSHVDLRAGNVVEGTLPVNLACAVCEQGGRHLHPSLKLSADLHGRELIADEMAMLDVNLNKYVVTRLE